MKENENKPDECELCGSKPEELAQPEWQEKGLVFHQEMWKCYRCKQAYENGADQKEQEDEQYEVRTMKRVDNKLEEYKAKAEAQKGGAV